MDWQECKSLLFSNLAPNRSVGYTELVITTVLITILILSHSPKTLKRSILSVLISYVCPRQLARPPWRSLV